MGDAMDTGSDWNPTQQHQYQAQAQHSSPFQATTHPNSHEPQTHPQQRQEELSWAPSSHQAQPFVTTTHQPQYPSTFQTQTFGNILRNQTQQKQQQPHYPHPRSRPAFGPRPNI